MVYPTGIDSLQRTPGGCCSNDRNTCETRFNLWRSFILRARRNERWAFSLSGGGGGASATVAFGWIVVLGRSGGVARPSPSAWGDAFRPHTGPANADGPIANRWFLLCAPACRTTHSTLPIIPSHHHHHHRPFHQSSPPSPTIHHVTTAACTDFRLRVSQLTRAHTRLRVTVYGALYTSL